MRERERERDYAYDRERKMSCDYQTLNKGERERDDYVFDREGERGVGIFMRN